MFEVLRVEIEKFEVATEESFVGMSPSVLLQIILDQVESAFDSVDRTLDDAVRGLRWRREKRWSCFKVAVVMNGDTSLFGSSSYRGTSSTDQEGDEARGRKREAVDEESRIVVRLFRGRIIGSTFELRRV